MSLVLGTCLQAVLFNSIQFIDRLSDLGTYLFIGNSQAEINSDKLVISVQSLYLQASYIKFYWPLEKKIMCSLYMVPVLNILKSIFSWLYDSEKVIFNLILIDKTQFHQER